MQQQHRPNVPEQKKKFATPSASRRSHVAPNALQLAKYVITADNVAGQESVYTVGRSTTAYHAADRRSVNTARGRATANFVEVEVCANTGDRE